MHVRGWGVCKDLLSLHTPYPVGLPPYGGLEVRGMGYGALQEVDRSALQL